MRRRHNYSNIHDLFLSLVNGTKHEVESYINSGGNINLTGPDGSTLLLQCLKNRSTEKVAILIHSGADVNIPDNHGCCPVHTALEQGDNSILSMLLSNGAAVTFVYQHMTPLMMAARNNDVAAARLLLDSGIDCGINMENYCQETALAQAIITGSKEMCQLLLINGADIKSCYCSNFRSKINKHLLNDTELMEVFLKHSDGVNLHFHLLMACILKKIEVAKLLLNFYPNPFQLKGLGFITKQEEDSLWEELTKCVTKPYRLATKCSSENELLEMLLSFCGASEQESCRRIHKQRACSMIRVLVQHGLVIHPQTSLKSCRADCECRKCIFTALYGCPSVTSLKAQCCSQIRQSLSGQETKIDLNLVHSLPIPETLKQFICFDDW